MLVLMTSLTVNCGRGSKVSLGSIDINPKPSVLILYNKKNNGNFNLLENNVLNLKKQIFKKQIRIFTSQVQVNYINSQNITKTNQTNLMIQIFAKKDQVKKIITGLNDNVMNQFFTRKLLFYYYSTNSVNVANQVILILEKRKKSFLRYSLTKKLQKIQNENEKLSNFSLLSSVESILLFPNSIYDSAKLIYDKSNTGATGVLLSGEYYKQVKQLTNHTTLSFTLLK